MKIFSIISLFLLSVSCVHNVRAQTAQFPSALATDANLKVAVNGVSTLLTAALNTVTTTTSVSSCSGIIANVLVTIDQEIMPVSGCSGTVLVFGSRGFDGTSAATHASGSTIYAYIDAWHHNSLRVEVEAIEATLGTSLANVILPGSSPSFVNGVFSGTVSVAGTLSVTGATTLSSTLGVGAITSTGAFVVSCGSCSGGYAGSFTSTGVEPGLAISSGSGVSLNATTSGSQGAIFNDSSGTCRITAISGLNCNGANSQLVNTNSSVTFAAIATSGGFTGGGASSFSSTLGVTGRLTVIGGITAGLNTTTGGLQPVCVNISTGIFYNGTGSAC